MTKASVRFLAVSYGSVCQMVGCSVQDRALEAKWEARENVRRRDLAQAQTDYGKVCQKIPGGF